MMWLLGEDQLKIHEVWHGWAVASTGARIRDHHAFTIWLDFAEGTFTGVGLGFGAWVEGTSIRHLNRGRVIENLATGVPIFMAGKGDVPFDPHEITCRLIAEAAG